MSITAITTRFHILRNSSFKEESKSIKVATASLEKSSAQKTDLGIKNGSAKVIDKGADIKALTELEGVLKFLESDYDVKYLQKWVEVTQNEKINQTEKYSETYKQWESDLKKLIGQYDSSIEELQNKIVELKQKASQRAEELKKLNQLHKEKSRQLFQINEKRQRILSKVETQLNAVRQQLKTLDQGKKNYLEKKFQLLQDERQLTILFNDKVARAARAEARLQNYPKIVMRQTLKFLSRQARSATLDKEAIAKLEAEKAVLERSKATMQDCINALAEAKSTEMHSFLNETGNSFATEFSTETQVKVEKELEKNPDRLVFMSEKRKSYFAYDKMLENIQRELRFAKSQINSLFDESFFSMSAKNKDKTREKITHVRRELAEVMKQMGKKVVDLMISNSGDYDRVVKLQADLEKALTSKSGRHYKWETAEAILREMSHIVNFFQ